MRPLTCIAFLGSVAAVTACQSNAPRPGAVQISLDWQAPDTCRVSIAGETLNKRDSDRLIQALERATTKSHDAFLRTGDLNVPYKCVGSVIITAQQAGFEHIGFTAEPPPKR